MNSQPLQIEQFYPTLTAAFIIVFAIWRAVVPILKEVGRAMVEFSETKMSTHEMRKDIAEIKPKVDIILQVQTQQLNDGKRLDRVEARLDEIGKRQASGA